MLEDLWTFIASIPEIEERIRNMLPWRAESRAFLWLSVGFFAILAAAACHIAGWIIGQLVSLAVGERRNGQ